MNHNFFLDLNNIKKNLRFIPVQSKSNDFIFSHPLGKIRKSKGVYEVYVGNELITKLKPQYFEICPKGRENFAIEVDGKLFSISKASKFFVHDDFKVLSIKGYRVNIIGFSSKNKLDESEITIRKNDMNKFYSIDRDGNIYRIEFYKQDEFCAMVLVQFR